MGAIEFAGVSSDAPDFWFFCLPEIRLAIRHDDSGVCCLADRFAGSFHSDNPFVLTAGPPYRPFGLLCVLPDFLRAG